MVRGGRYSRIYAEAKATALPGPTAAAIVEAMNAGALAGDMQRKYGVPKRAALALHGSHVLGRSEIVCNHTTISASRETTRAARRAAWKAEHAADMARRRAAAQTALGEG